jgi:hypothetical protein
MNSVFTKFFNKIFATTEGMRQVYFLCSYCTDCILEEEDKTSHCVYAFHSLLDFRVTISLFKMYRLTVLFRKIELIISLIHFLIFGFGVH